MSEKPAPAAPPVELLTPRAFGQALGVSRQAVQKAIKAGRLQASVRRDERTGRNLIELHAGRAEWEAWTDPTKRHEHARGGRPVEAEKGTPSMFDPAETARAAVVRTNLATTRTEQVQLDVELRRLELEQRRGNLVDRGEVQREAFRLARLVRDRLQAIPDRSSASLAALDNPGQVHQLLLEEITRALEALDPREGAAEA
jgi:hypothetical protein